MTYRCDQCRFWKRFDVESGQCCCHAPRPELSDFPEHATDPPWRAVWPLTLATDWCGDWAPLPVSQVKREVPPHG